MGGLTASTAYDVWFVAEDDADLQLALGQLKLYDSARL